MIVILLILLFKYISDKRKKVKLFDAESQLIKEKLIRNINEEKRLQEEISFKNQDLIDFALDSMRKNELTEEILKRLKGIAIPELKSSDEISEIIRFVKSQITIDENLKLIQDNLNQVNHKFMNTIQCQFPLLSKNEKQLCALLRLNLSSKEIATVKNISPDSVKTMRYRIRKKLGLSNDVSLSDFLLSIK